MDNSNIPPSPPAPAPSTPPLVPVKNENFLITPKLEELNEAKRDLLDRIQILKQDLQGWMTKLDAQTKAYHNELSNLKTSLDTDVSELRKEFQDLRDTLQQQQNDAAETLRSFGVHVESDLLVPKVEVKEEIHERPAYF